MKTISLITGGAGFIGTNLAHRLLSTGRRVRILDNLGRPGVERNLDWLRRRHGGRLEAIVGDMRDPRAVRRAVADVDSVYHFAAQVAVTTSLTAPVEDFDINLRGTMHLLEALRARRQPVPLVFTSTNKVYGNLCEIELAQTGRRYQPVDVALRSRGVDENRPLDFHSPYGCSKGAADQYVLDYARSFGLPTVVFRMSCIYGPHQHGTEDQGWVAHFLIQALAREPIRIYGDGMQVRDVLFVEDLVEALLAARKHAGALAGQAFNIGGGPAHTISLLELIEQVERLTGRKMRLVYEGWRTGDQKYYVSDTGRFGRATGWSPQVDVRTGLAHLHRWLVLQQRAAARPAAQDDPLINEMSG